MKKIKKADTYFPSSAAKTVRTICVIIIMVVLSCALSILILSAAGVITFEKSDNLHTGIVYNNDSDEKSEPVNNISNHNSVQTTDSPEKRTRDVAEVISPEVKNDNDLENTEKVKGTVVLDPGHGILSSSMSDLQKQQNGWLYNAQENSWGQWRHFKSNTMWQDCLGSECIGRTPKDKGCWYPISNGDRETEPELNMNNALSAKKYLEEMGYAVRLTRTSTDNPSMTKRLEFCYPNNDISKDPDADIFVCLHSNAGGGTGSCYIALSGQYDQKGISADYVENGNRLGKYINDRIVSQTGLSASSGGRYDECPELILFFKSPIPIAYMEIGFYDNASDLNILETDSDAIGKAIADGIDDYMRSLN